jgi:FkbM family methyltransferase
MRLERYLSPHELEDRLHTDGVDRWLGRSGVRSHVGSLYQGATYLHERAMMATSDTHTIEVGDASATFHAPTLAEFRDLHRLPERPVIEDHIARLRPEDVFYDIGANIGVYSCLVRSVTNGDVVAFEPHPANADRFERNVALNDAAIPIHRCALSDTAETAEFAIPLDIIGSAGHTLLADRHPDARTISVETVVGERFIADERLPAPTVVKIDVEGAELAVLRGLKPLIERPDCRLLYCEVHDERPESRGSSLSEVRDLLQDSGFSTSPPLPVRREGYPPIIRAEKDSP